MQTAFIALMKRKLIISVPLFWGPNNVLRICFPLLLFKCTLPSFQSILDVFFVFWEATSRGKINSLLYKEFFPRKMEKVEYYPAGGINIFRSHRKAG